MMEAIINNIGSWKLSRSGMTGVLISVPFTIWIKPEGFGGGMFIMLMSMIICLLIGPVFGMLFHRFISAPRATEPVVVSSERSTIGARGDQSGEAVDEEPSEVI